MAKQIVCTIKAKNELIDILQYWVNQNHSDAFSIKLNNLIGEQLSLIAKYPYIGRATDIENVYLKVIQNYLLYYEIVGNTLFVLTVRHGGQNPQTLKLK